MRERKDIIPPGMEIISNRLKTKDQDPAKLDAAIEKPNLQTVDVATLPADADNPYGLRALWGQGDIVARLTLLILLIMSVASWYVLVRKLIEQRRLRLQSRRRRAAAPMAARPASSSA